MKNYPMAAAAKLRQLLRRRRGGRRGVASMIEVERAEYLFYLAYLREGMTVFDVGAHVGELTLLFSRFAPGGQVHAFEASREVFDRLTTVCRVAARCRDHITLNHIALAEEEKNATLYVYDEPYLAWNTLAARPLENYGISVRPVRTEQVPATTIDLYCRRKGITRIDLLKIDTEGAEYQVLLGARAMLAQQRIGCLTFEFGQTTFDMGNTPEEIENYLTGFGYGVRNLVDGDPLFPGGAGGAPSAIYSMHAAMPLRPVS